MSAASTRAAVLACGLSLSLTALAGDEPDISQWPPAVQEQYPVFQQRCASCHTLTRVFASKFSADDWKGYIKKLIRQPGSGINEESARQIFAVLKQLEATRPATPAVPPGGFAEEVLPFGEGMTKPVPDAESMRTFPIEYSREALAAKIEGTMLLKCVILADGTARECKVVKPVPFMTEAVLAAVTKWHFSPVTFQGKPVNCNVMLPLKLSPR